MAFDTVDDTKPGDAGKIRTFSGRLVDPWDLHPQDILIEDIAHALSLICRFTGHVRHFYSVAQHCILVSSLLQNPRTQLAGLLHDGAEAYFNDLAGPTKCRPCMQGYKDAEKDAENRIMHRFNLFLDERETAQVKAADNSAYYMERNALMRPGPDEPYGSGPTLTTARHGKEEELYLELFDIYSKQVERGH